MGSGKSRINGDLIKDYSWTKIKINLTPAAEEANKRGKGEGGRGGRWCDVEAVCSSTSRPTALIIRWRQMEEERERERWRSEGGGTYTIRKVGTRMEAFF